VQQAKELGLPPGGFVKLPEIKRPIEEFAVELFESSIKESERKSKEYTEKRQKELADVDRKAEDEILNISCLRPHGRGVLLLKDYDGKGTGVYEGYWHFGRKHGHGRETLYTMEIYEGGWQHDLKQDKKGEKWDFKNNWKYQGGFSKGNMSGKGKRTDDDGTVYVGTFYNDKKHGTGMQINAEGITHDGDFEKDVKHGFGYEIGPDAKYIKGGIWRGNKYCKECTAANNEGRVM